MEGREMEEMETNCPTVYYRNTITVPLLSIEQNLVFFKYQTSFQLIWSLGLSYGRVGGMFALMYLIKNKRGYAERSSFTGRRYVALKVKKMGSNRTRERTSGAAAN